MLCQQTHRPTLDHDVARHSADNTSRLTSHARSVVLEPSNVLSPTHGTLAALKIDLATASDGVPTSSLWTGSSFSASEASGRCELSPFAGVVSVDCTSRALMSPPSTVDRGALYTHRMPIIQLVVLFDPGLPANKEISISTHTQTTAFPQVALIQIHESEPFQCHAATNPQTSRLRGKTSRTTSFKVSVRQRWRRMCFIPRGGQRAGRPYELHVATPRRRLATIGLGLYPLRTQAHGWLARVHNVDELKQDAAGISNVTMMQGRRGLNIAALLNANPGRRMGGAHIV
ncbi:hypothetical protein C8F01DRAFT_1256211 [Mycena amicta]|nr:hypothetical protein C8F01DRAFT_1256211 [Mycena amicta]